jgi:hypothetical protein
MQPKSRRHESQLTAQSGACKSVTVLPLHLFTVDALPQMAALAAPITNAGKRQPAGVLADLLNPGHVPLHASG